jgi:lysozyme family protein/peptidoglycan hydrolase-like protein with peptidoglycan-binding domain
MASLTSELKETAMAGFSYGALAKDYARLWHAMKISPAVLAAVDARVRAIARGRPRYDQVANATGVPWFVIGIIHDMEAGLKFTAHLHNGDPLSARTSHEPAGRPAFGLPPFEWEDSAIDALAMKKLGEVKLWTIERIAYQLEAYNGWGYRTRNTGIHTPYLWSATSHYKKGKFVRDRVFNPDAVSRQIGAMALLRRLMDIQGVNVPVESDVPEPDTAAPSSDANLSKQPYPDVVVSINHPDPAVVMLLQRRLNQLGCWPTVHANGQTSPLIVDGDFGPATLAALKLFQARSFDADGKASAVDGVAGPLTWAALFAEAPQPEPKPPHTPIPLLSKVLEVAGNELQVREAPLGSNRGPRVDEYLRAAGIDPKTGSYPWCAGFIVWCFENAARSVGVVSPVPRTAGVHDMWQKAGRSGFRRIAYDIAMGDPHQVRAGHVFFIDTGGGHGHVGLVTGRQGADFQTIEGNTNELGGREGIGVFARTRPVRQATLGFVEFAPR